VEQHICNESTTNVTFVQRLIQVSVELIFPRVGFSSRARERKKVTRGTNLRFRRWTRMYIQLQRCALAESSSWQERWSGWLVFLTYGRCLPLKNPHRNHSSTYLTYQVGATLRSSSFRRYHPRMPLPKYGHPSSPCLLMLPPPSSEQEIAASIVFA